VFGPPVMRVLTHLDDSIAHQRPERMGQCRQLDGEPARQLLQRRSSLIGTHQFVDLCDERELRGLEIQRRQGVVKKLAKPASREAQ